MLPNHPSIIYYHLCNCGHLLCVLQLKENRVYDVKVIVQNITKGARNELERLRAIWVWLCHNIGGYFTTHLHINPSIL